MTELLESEFAQHTGRNDLDQDLDSFKAPDLSPEQYAEHTANQAANVFQRTGLFEVVEVKAGIGQIHLMGRVKQDNERTFLDKVIDPVLRAIESLPECEGHICKQFLLHNGRTKYAWTVSLAANNLREAAHAICEAIDIDIAPRYEVTEAPLVGKGTPIGGGPGGGRKGATPVR